MPKTQPPPMTAKLIITEINAFESGSEIVKFRAVCKSDGYDETGLDENNSYAIASPMFTGELHIHNPALVGAYRPGQTFKVHFEPCDQ